MTTETPNKETEMSVFLNIDSKGLAKQICSAQSTVIYAAPGLDDVVAGALIKAAKNIGGKNVSVLLDVSEDVLRFGYGNIDGITLLREKGIATRGAYGLRLGMLVCDNEGVIFAPTPLLIEAGRVSDSQPNAVKATSDQIGSLVAAIAPPKTTDTSENSEPEIGKTEVSEEVTKELEEKIQNDPPQSFDIARKVRVYSAALEFVEIKLNGCDIQRRTVRIPADMLVGKIDAATKKRLNTGYKLIEQDSHLSSKNINIQLDQLKERYLRKIPKYGYVLLKSRKEFFRNGVNKIEKSVAKFQKTVENHIDKEIAKSRKNLINFLVPATVANPPNKLFGIIAGPKPTKKEVEHYLNQQLDCILPTPESITIKMSLDCIFKAVTPESILDEEFRNTIKKTYPSINWDEGMMGAYDAIAQT